MAACRLAARGRSLSDNTYESEVKSILNFLEIQKPALAPAISPSSLDISPEDYISPRHVKKLKNKVRPTLVNSSIYGRWKVVLAYLIDRRETIYGMPPVAKYSLVPGWRIEIVILIYLFP